MVKIAFTALHYGAVYLGWAIRGVIDAVDEYHIVYSATGSHGHLSDAHCPDARDDLLEIAQRAAGDKLRWHEGRFRHEGEQRDSIFEFAPHADAILVVDYDEIYPPGLAREALDLSEVPAARHYRLPFVHFWRSFHRAILRDPAYPVRVINPHINKGDVTRHLKPVAHLGYAIPSELCSYKLGVHGHRNEFRRDCDWFRDVFMSPTRTTDLHPVGSEYWNAEPVDPLDYMPSWMATHPYFNLERIP